MNNPHSGNTSSSVSSQILQEAAALVMQLPSERPADLRALKKLLKQLSDDVSLNAETRSSIDEALQLLSQLKKSGTSDQEIFNNVGDLITKAVDAAEGRISTDESPDTSNPDALPADADLNFIAEFVTETLENIGNAEAALLSLESNPDDKESINTVFRAFHTTKGVSMWLGLTRLADLAHHAESVLSRIREGQVRMSGGYADLTLHAVDMLKELIQSVQSALAGGPMTKPAEFDQLLKILSDPEAAGVNSEAVFPTVPRLGDILVAEGGVSRDVVELAAAEQEQKPIGEQLVHSGAASVTTVAKALRTQQSLNPQNLIETSVRVQTERLDSLINLVGELVIAQSIVAQDETLNQSDNYELGRKVSHAGKIVRELQDLTMSMRMIPLRGTFQKMARLSRDAAHKCGKTVHFVAEGEETEIDRSLVDVLNDPLMHMVRNAVDHGIEPSDVRLQNGKPASGQLRLSAYYAGGAVVIELSDDGAGLNKKKILEKAIARKLVDADKELSESDIFALILEPGFSTSDKVTELSGRGVGMDVVKRGIESVRGRIEIQSQPGLGTTFIIRLPLTLAITDGMLVGVGQERYIIPTISINKSFRPDKTALSTVAGQGEMVRLREELLPLFRLHRLFNVEDAVTEPENGLLVVVDDGKRSCALLVDNLLGKQQVVAKSLGAGLSTQGITGGAILGDGRVGLILDPIDLVALARSGSAGSPGLAAV